MKIVNINIHFYPESYGGATIVAEKLAHGLVSMGHDVYNIALSMNGGDKGKDFSVYETPFGKACLINGAIPTAENRFRNSPVESVISEILGVVQPDEIYVHAPQNLGVMYVLEDGGWISKTKIIAHDFFWVCMQGFRTLPNGKKCDRVPSHKNCYDCAFYPGLINQTYSKLLSSLSQCKAVIFPSQYLKDEYDAILLGMTSRELNNFHVVRNPDKAESVYEPPVDIRLGKDDYNIAYFGGPGYTKGWDIVKKLHKVSPEKNYQGKKIVYNIFDAGRVVGSPWYGRNDESTNFKLSAPFHWSYAGHIFANIDLVLMPSRVSESFGMSAREVLSSRGCALIFTNGALNELSGFDSVYEADENDVEEVYKSIISGRTENPILSAKEGSIYNNTSSLDYAEMLLEI